jgi:tungstate transport system ATP-binding protein
VLLKRSVIENVAFALIARGVARADAERTAMEKLEATGLATFSDRYARTLSGGEQQKLALARAWAMQPKLLLADEPTANLAPASVHAVESILQRIGDAGTTLIFATHNRGQAKRLATRIVFMADGRVAEDQTANDFFAKPLSAEAIDYLNVERA